MMTMQTLPMWLQEITEINVNAGMPNWLVKEKQKAWDHLLKKGMPTRKDENYKYTDFSFLANKNYMLSQQKEFGVLTNFISENRIQNATSICLVMINGIFQAALSDFKNCPNSISIMRVADAMVQYPNMLKQSLQNQTANYFSELNLALFTDGLFIHIPDHIQLDQPIHVLSILTGQHENLVVPRNIFIIGKHAKVHFLEEYRSLHANSAFHNLTTHWHVQENAIVQSYKMQNENGEASHFATTVIEQEDHSQFELVNITKGGIFSRDDIIAHLHGVGANCLLSGLYSLNHKSQYVDHHIEINHQAENSHSEMLYKGILHQASRAVFNGRLHVEKNAQRINAYQANHHLLLSSEAEAYSKPELEIYADDVKCKHGATIGQVNEEALFYLQARGIPKRQAMAILIQGFADEIFKRIHHKDLLAHMQETI
jgi:Fe-S cluster assembly protein SufD